MTSGGLLVARVAMKPLSTLNRPVLRTVDVETKEETVSFKERTDVTAVPAAGVVAETMVALVLAVEKSPASSAATRWRSSPATSRRTPLRCTEVRRSGGVGGCPGRRSGVDQCESAMAGTSCSSG